MDILIQQNIQAALICGGVLLTVWFLKLIPTRREVDVIRDNLEKIGSQNKSELRDWQKSNCEVINKLEEVIQGLSKIVHQTNNRVSRLEGIREGEKHEN